MQLGVRSMRPHHEKPLGARMSKPIYLDYNATTPVDSAVVEAMEPYLREHFGNPSSDHAYGYRTRLAVQTAREQLAALLGAAPDEVIFTGSSNQWRQSIPNHHLLYPPSPRSLALMG
jgi:selenocysteine lyase/cysteine desulfurase